MTEATKDTATVGVETPAGKVIRGRTRRDRSLSATYLLRRFGVLAAMVITFAVFSAIKPEAFLSWVTLKAIPRDMAPLLVMALAATVVLVMNDFDLSMGGMLGFCGTMAVILTSSEYANLSLPLALIFTLIFGAALGFANGVMIAYAGASSFIITIASGTLYNGLDLVVLKSNTIFIGVSESYFKIASGTILGLSNQMWIALAVLVVVYVFLMQSETGRHMYAIGGNREAARFSGIRVRRLRTLGFMIVGMSAAVAGVLVSSQARAANPNSGLGVLLPAYAAAFLGSTMWGGKFTPIGTLLGALFLQVIGTGLALFNLRGAVVLVIQGGILLVAVLLSRVGRR